MTYPITAYLIAKVLLCNFTKAEQEHSYENWQFYFAEKYPYIPWQAVRAEMEKLREP